MRAAGSLFTSPGISIWLEVISPLQFSSPVCSLSALSFFLSFFFFFFSPAGSFWLNLWRLLPGFIARCRLQLIFIGQKGEKGPSFWKLNSSIYINDLSHAREGGGTRPAHSHTLPPLTNTRRCFYKVIHSFTYTNISPLSLTLKLYPEHQAVQFEKVSCIFQIFPGTVKTLLSAHFAHHK